MHNFIPGTMERKVASNIVYRPIRAWHSNTYAGEGLKTWKGDRSGCLRDDGLTCIKPYTVTHRIYWNTQTQEEISSFLSYPNAMGCCDDYFWEIYDYKSGETSRYATEEEMEAKVISLLTEFVDV